MRVTFVHDPNAEEATDVAAQNLNRPDVGIVAFRVPPETRRVLNLYGAFLNALGKRDDERNGWDRANSLASIDASAWAQAHAVRHVVVNDANHAYGPIIVELCQWATSNNADVTLVASGFVTLNFYETISTWVDEWDSIAHLSRLDAAFPTPSAETDDQVLDLPDVPGSDFLTFRADAQRQMPEHFPTIDAIYTSTLSNLADEPFTDEERTAAAIHEYLCKYTDPARQTIAMRAIQAAAFNVGVHIDIDLAGVLRAVGPTASLRWLTRDQWKIVNSSSRPSSAAIVALLAAGIPEIRIPTLERSHVDDDGITVTNNGTENEVPEAAQLAIRAQLHIHTRAGWGSEDPFIYDTARTSTRAVRDRLNRYASKIGVNLRLAHDSLTNNHWQYRYGVTLAPLGSVTA